MDFPAAYVQYFYDPSIPRRSPVYKKPFYAFNLPEDTFIKYFRLSKELAANLCDSIREDLEPLAGRRNILSTETQVLCALRFYASGSYQQSVANDYCLQMSQPSASRCIRRVSEAINRRLLRQWVKFPSNDRDIHELKFKFNQIAGFPGTIGAIDCTHVEITPPPKNDPIVPEHIFVNRHGSHSINVQVICDPNLVILNCNARFPGSSHDSFIWRNCAAKRKIMQIQGGIPNSWLVGDSGYPLEPWLLVPKHDPIVGTPEDRYNTAHAKTRNVVERCFGVLKSRFRCLSYERVLHYSPATAAKIINACIVLHNMCKARGLPDPEIDPNVHRNYNQLPDLSQTHVEGLRTQTHVINTYFS